MAGCRVAGCDLAPCAKRGLLIQWGDRDTAEPILRAMSLGAFDYYVPKPTTSPDEQFHFLVGQFLYDWARAQGTGFKPVRMVGEHSTTRMHELRDLVDLAPWVPVFTPSHASIVSKRVGNYQYNPEWGILLDQLWVR